MIQTYLRREVQELVVLQVQGGEFAALPWCTLSTARGLHVHVYMCTGVQVYRCTGTVQVATYLRGQVLQLVVTAVEGDERLEAADSPGQGRDLVLSESESSNKVSQQRNPPKNCQETGWKNKLKIMKRLNQK